MHPIPGLRASVRALFAATVAVAALAAAPASAQLIQIGNGSDPVAPSICPGDTTPVQVNSFTLSHPTSAIVAGIRLKFTSADAVTLVSQIQIRQGGTTIGTVVPTASGANVNLASRITVGPSPTALTIWAVPKAAGEMPTLARGLSFGIYADSTVSSYSSGATADTSPLASLDTVPDSDVTLTGLSAAATTIGLTWSATRDVLVLRTVGGPVTDRPANGTTYTTGTIGSAAIVSAGLLGSVSDGGRTTGKPYYYRVFTKDVCRNWSEGVPVGPVYPGGVAVGDATAGSLVPVVGILNPVGGVVTAPFRVQARVFTPSPRTIGAVSLQVDDGVNAPTTQTLYRNSNYGTATSSGVFEVGPFVGGDSPGLTLAPGRYTIRVQATDNAAGSAWSAPVGLVVNAGKGDGNLLVRDNSSQLCSDCHALPTHSSEATGTKYGSWFAGCRACHAPHGTTNASLVANQITPPGVRGQFPPTRTAFSKHTGFDPAAGTTNTATLSAATFANGDRTGPCQVCHTATDHYRRNGTEPLAHYSGQCTVCHSHTGGFAVTGGCTSCHGSPDAHPGYASEAPPNDTCGNTAPGGGGNNRVGAHAKHLLGSSSMSNGVTCNECHTDPPTRAGHPGAVCSTNPADRAQMTWGAIATGSVDPWSGTVTPTWDVATQGCTNYCHGNFRNGSNATVTWNSTVACGSCHALPPAGTHPVTASACSVCHGAGYETTGISGGALITHVDGRKDGGGNNCYGCHGSDRALATGVETTLDRYKAAPPNQAAIPGVTNPTTQAHLSHTYNGTVRLPLTCDNCHPDTTSLTHTNSLLDLSWGPLSRVGGVTPNYVGSPNFTCATTYCHGAAFPADTRGSATVPAWTSTDGSFKDCGDCHGAPPANAKHTSLWSRGAATPAQCNACHSPTVTAAGAIDLAGGKHVDGVYDTLNVTCASCHGNPPTNTLGLANAANTNGVGAHQQHAVAPLQTRTAAFACVACHPNNTSNIHADGSPTMTFASGLGPTTAWNDGGSSCTTSYCHGDTTGTAPIYKGGLSASLTSSAQGSWGGNAKQPVWTTTNGTYRACTACHAAPPAAPHPSNTTCADCHPAGASQTAMTGAAAGTHVDGHVDITRTGCTACHGDYGSDVVASGDVKAAPGYFNGTAFTGRDVAGLTTGGTKIGGHNAHLQRTDLRTRLVRCDECHAVPAANDTSHAAGVAAVDMAAATSTTAKTGGLTPTYSAGNCASVYCHGAGYTARGANYVGSNTTLSWTDGTAARACGACHAVAPTTSVHNAANNLTTPQNCNACHGAAYNCLKTNLAACQVDMAKHINGVGEYPTGCTDCHGQPPATGSHVAHVNQTTLRSTTLDCNNCHGTKPLAGNISHADGIEAIGWSQLATSGVTATPAAANPPGFVTTVSCSNYCHAPGTAAVYGGTARTLNWGAAAVTCTSCHAAPPPVSATAGVDHPQNTNCALCHGAGYTSPTLAASAKTTHIDGSVVAGKDKPANGCTACHGVLAGVTGGAVANTSATAAPGYNGTGVDTAGNSAITTRTVGAHDAHVRGTTYRTASITCTECHGTLPGTGDTSHANATIAISWGTLATTGGAAPNWNGTTCATSYCHGQGLTGGANKTPTWTLTGQAVCGDCHQVNGTSHYGNNCETCHGTGYVTTGLSAAAKGTHMNGTVEAPGATCVGCHTTAMTIKKAPSLVGQTRRPIIPEFQAASSHKRSETTPGSVSDEDCAVCHMEGVPKSGARTASHGDGYVDLRDPDTGTTIENVYWTASPDAAGGYVTTTVTANRYARFERFSRNLASNVLEEPVKAIMINQCLHCHDANGASNADAQVSGGIAAKPFNTTIAGAAYTGTGVTANNTLGGVTDVKASFATSNSSYHPILGKQNNWYTKRAASGTQRMVAPWNAPRTGTTPNITDWGYLMSCWDCHAKSTDTGTITYTVTAHGAAPLAADLRGSTAQVVLRGAAFTGVTTAPTGTAQAVTLCNTCHQYYNTCGSTTDACASTMSHGSGSTTNTAFFPSTGRSTKTPYLRYGCNMCHSSGYTTAVVRPIRAQDTHGMNAVIGTGTKTDRWALATTQNRPYAFIRNINQLANHSPRSVAGTLYEPQCNMRTNPCQQGVERYDGQNIGATLPNPVFGGFY